MADSSSDNKNPPPPAMETHAPATGYPPPAPHPSYHPYQAYPYPAPPPPPYPAYPYQSHPQPGRSTVFLRRFLLLLIAAFVILGAISLILWLVLRPHLPRVFVTSASVSPFNQSTVSLTADWDFSFRVDNPNGKMGVFYDRIDASVLYDLSLLADTSVPPMYQGQRNSTSFSARLAAVSEYVDNWKGMAEERGKGVVKFDVRLVAWVRFRAGAWRTRRRMLRAFCGDVPVTFNGAGAGNFSGQPRECNVDI